MADRHVPFLLIGGGTASAAAAVALAEAGRAADVLLVGRELDPPYHRPPITKGLLRGTEAREDGRFALPDAVEVLTRTSVTALDPDARVATLSTKQTVSFDHALLATGAMVRRLPLPGAGLDGIHYLRAPGNAEALRGDLDGAAHVVLVGGSFIATEVAASLAELGIAATMLMQEPEPLAGQYGEQAGRWARAGLEARGVTVRGGVEVEAFTGEGDRVEGVTLAGGETVPADVVVCGVGALPDVMLARKAGLTLGPSGGVLADPQLRSVSHPAILAAGDVCEYGSALHGRDLRVEHEDHATAQGRTAARTMLGGTAPHEEVPHFWSELGDWGFLESVGPAASWASEAVEGSIDEGAFAVSYLDADGRLVAYLSVGEGGDITAATERLRSGAGVA